MLSSSPTTLSPITTSSSAHGIPRRKLRVSAEHTLNRVRENQRRHRARQKDYVASLELKLSGTEQQLAEARVEIEALKAERDTANALACYDISKHFERLDSAVAIGPWGIPSIDSPSPNSLLTPPIPTGNIEPTPVTTSFQLLPPPMQVAEPPPCCTNTISTTPIPSEPLSTTVATATTRNVDPECSVCRMRPPPGLLESTTLCAQAFVMISQQNFRNLDPELIRMWLSRGYRRAAREGEGCRVENGTLKGLLEYISGV